MEVAGELKVLCQFVDAPAMVAVILSPRSAYTMINRMDADHITSVMKALCKHSTDFTTALINTAEYVCVHTKEFNANIKECENARTIF